MAGIRGMDRTTKRLDGLGNKFCSGCSEFKPLDAFHVRKASPDGRHGYCKACRSTGKKLTPLVDLAGHKTCRKCSVMKPIEEFHFLTRSSDGRQSHCKACAAYGPEARERKLRLKYGIGLADYEAMLTAQGGRCRICGSTDPKTKGGEFFAVDHCHATGKVRGLLCVPCNLLIGYAQDNTDTLRSAIEYLDRSSDLF